MQPVRHVVVLVQPLDARLGVEGVCGAMQQVRAPLGIIRVRVCEHKGIASAFVQAANPEALHEGQDVTAVVHGKDVDERHQVHPGGHDQAVHPTRVAEDEFADVIDDALAGNPEAVHNGVQQQHYHRNEGQLRVLYVPAILGARRCLHHGLQARREHLCAR